MNPTLTSDQTATATDASTTIPTDLTVDRFVGAELDRYQEELRAMMQHANRSVEMDPIVHLQTRTVVGAEALARFPGALSTAGWFQLAYALGIGDQLELSIIEAVVEHADVRRHGFIGVNVSPAVLVDPACIAALGDAADDRIVIEVTDQTTVAELGLLNMHLDRIRDAGVRIAIHVSTFDCAALRSLRSLEPDMVKLDPALTASLAAGETDEAATEAFFAECRAGGAFVVAVGVERADQIAELERRHVDAFQGRLARALDTDA